MTAMKMSSTTLLSVAVLRLRRVASVMMTLTPWASVLMAALVTALSLVFFLRYFTNTFYLYL